MPKREGWKSFGGAVIGPLIWLGGRLTSDPVVLDGIARRNGRYGLQCANAGPQGVVDGPKPALSQVAPRFQRVMSWASGRPLLSSS